MDKAIVQGWGFVNHKKNPIQVLKTENESDKLQFQTDVGGIFVAAQFDWENGNRTEINFPRFSGFLKMSFELFWSYIELYNIAQFLIYWKRSKIC